MYMYITVCVFVPNFFFSCTCLLTSCVCVSLSLQSGSINIRIVVMNNLLPSSIRYHEKYDLKGSTYKRRAGQHEMTKKSPTFKDLDFMEKHAEVFSLSLSLLSLSPLPFSYCLCTTHSSVHSLPLLKALYSAMSADYLILVIVQKWMLFGCMHQHNN